MKKLKWAAIGSILFGVVLLALGAYYGQGEFYILLFIPVYKGTGVLSLVGGLLIFVGIVLGMVHFFRSYVPYPYEQTPTTSPTRREREGAAPVQPRVRHGGVVFLGPIPIVWGSDARMTLFAIIAGIIIVVVLLVSIFIYLAFSAAFA
ncbi:MAG: DUF131 domain-containing protein [Thermoplasmata archaeon]